MSYRVSYLVPKTEYERMIRGKSSNYKLPKKTEDKLPKSRKRKPKEEIRLRDKLRKMIKVKRKPAASQRKASTGTRPRKKQPPKAEKWCEPESGESRGRRKIHGHGIENLLKG